MKADDDVGLDEKAMKAGMAVAKLPRPAVPAGLTARTLARVAAASIQRKLWILRPITNPFARCAAAAAIFFLLVPLSDLELAGNVGMGIERRVVGEHVVDRVENLMDGVLPRGAPDGYSQSELDAFNNVQSTNKRAVRYQKRVGNQRV